MGAQESGAAVAAGSAAGAAAAHRRRGPVDQAGRADRVPGGLLLRIRAAPAVDRTYKRNAQRYRDLYYRLHAEVDGPLDRVRRAVTDGGSDNAVLVRTSDHGDLLGAHGGLHQKWFNLYDEATRVPFVIARIGEGATSARAVTAPTSHVDLVPTLLGAAGIDVAAVAETLRRSRSPRCTRCPVATSCRWSTGHRPTSRVRCT